MKYPQLVSTRAVNAISDWLVSRLEQLGVEAPQIYTRLLLSLLQSSVQINDPIEFSNLETFFAHRKGSNRRYHPFDTNTIKKINAVQCLSDIVSSEQEIASIETLVDELFEKLIDIEKKLTDIEDDEQILVATLSVATTSLDSQVNQSNYSHHLKKHHKELGESGLNFDNGSDNNFITITSNIKVGEDECKSKRVIDNETDPKKQYFRAFPALTKEMEDSFRILRRNAKSLTWPVDKYKIASLALSNGEKNTNQSLDTKGNQESEKGQRESNSGEIISGGQNQVEIVHGGINSNCLFAATGVKRKTKRRRNQALSKGGKTIQNIRKSSCSGVGSSSNRYRSSSPFWDTDFEGCWEMGRDLIKEFIVKQNNRNRSTSESAAYTNMNHQLNPLEDHEMLQLQEPLEKIDKATSKIIKQSSPLIPPVDISFCFTESSPHAENDDDTLASLSEITDVSLNSARPLYKRDISGGSQEILPKEINDDQLDFAQFKAKFDSSLEALWNSTDADATGNTGERKNESSSDVYSMSSSIMQMSSLPPTVAPFKENLQNFWTNYYNHHFDLTKIASQTAETTAAANEMNFGFSSSAFGKDTIYTSDYCSMPSNLEELDKSTSSFKNRRNGDCCEGIETPINVFLQNSIWSKNPNVGAGDTDESFYKKVWNSTQKVNQKLDSLSGNVDTTTNDNSFHLPQYSKSKWSEGINIGPNASMPVQSQQPQLLVQVSEASTSSSTTISSCSAEQVGKHSNDIGSIFNIERHHGTIGGNNYNSGIVGIDCTDSSTTSTSTTSCSSYPHSNTYNWQTPLLGQSLQPDMQSWSSSNPISLTEMYESGTNVQQQFDGKHVMGKFFVPPIAANEINSVGPVMTLKNHSSTASGFIEYSRIKSTIKIIKQQDQIKQPNALQLQEQQYLARNKEPQPQQRYTEDENLLTSDRTHFHPIKTYADGHSFDICGALDIVEYERSQSGYLCLDNERYLEYTRNDTFLAEEDTTTPSSLHTQPFGGVPLYASSNCEAANCLENAVEHQCDFVIKFRIRNCDIACQTDDESPNKIATPSNDLHSTSTVLEQQHPLCLIFSSSLQGMKLQTTGLACNDAIEALNKAVAAAAKAAASTRNSNDSHWLPNAVTNYRSTAASAPWKTSKIKNIDSVNGDEVDFQSVDTGDNNCCSLNALQQWSMHEIGKKCELQGHDNNAEAHSLWGLCIACNNEFKSIPANRLLKDELQLEADEIMSDLKYMQDLYISEGAAAEDSDSDWDIGENLDDTMVVVGDKNIAATEEAKNESAGIKNYEERVMKDPLDSQEDNPCQQKQSAQAVLHKVNRLIADLLCRENSKSFGNVINSSTASLQAAAEEVELSSSLKSPQSSQFIGSLWSCNDEHNIWQQSQTNATFKPFDFLRQLNDGQQKSTVLTADEDSLLSHLSWEHENLAEIWEKQTPSPLNQNSSNKAAENLNVDEMNIKIEESYNECDEIQKNQLFPVPLTAVPTTTSADVELCSDAAHSLEINEQIKPNAAYKRVQQFLTANATAASTAFKLKISNRKRRHSASQNLFHISPNSTAITNHITNNNSFNNNNNNKTADLNQFNVVNSKPFKAEIEMQKVIKANSTENDYVYEDDDLYVCGINEATTMDAVNLTQPKQTIITCKYWTTLDPLACSPTTATEDMVEGATTTFSCLLDKNASILKHVTMVTRPLTR